jgi:hypothetical protein
MKFLRKKPSDRAHLFFLFFILLCMMQGCSNVANTEISSTTVALQTEIASLKATATAGYSSMKDTATAFSIILTGIATHTCTPAPNPTIATVQSRTPPSTVPTAINLEIIQKTFIVDYERILVIALITNHTPNAVLMSQYQISLFDVNDKLIQASTGILDYIPAEQTIALADILLTPRKTQYAPEYNGIAAIKIQIAGGVPSEQGSEEITPKGKLSTLDATYFESDYFPKVTGNIASEYDLDLFDIPVVAVLFDEEDIIVGGGFAYIPFIPANGHAPVEIGVIRSGKPDRVELLPRLSVYSFD